MRIEFDPDKRDKTLRERGLDFADAPEVFRGKHKTASDDRKDYGEKRFITIGRLKGRMIVLVWTPRRGARRIISLSKPIPMNKKPTKTNWIDPDDAPDLSTPEWREKFARAPLREGDKIVRRGRPRSPSPKQLVSLRLDREIVTHFKIDGPGWQTRINDVLREKARAATESRIAQIPKKSVPVDMLPPIGAGEVKTRVKTLKKNLKGLGKRRQATKRANVKRAPAKKRA